MDLLTVDEVAARLRVTVATIRWLRQEGRFAPAVRIGRRVLWDADELQAWVAVQRESEAA